jgi:hypothetical protein
VRRIEAPVMSTRLRDGRSLHVAVMSADGFL